MLNISIRCDNILIYWTENETTTQKSTLKKDIVLAYYIMHFIGYVYYFLHHFFHPFITIVAQTIYCSQSFIGQFVLLLNTSIINSVYWRFKKIQIVVVGVSDQSMASNAKSTLRSVNKVLNESNETHFNVSNRVNFFCSKTHEDQSLFFCARLTHGRMLANIML